MYALVYAALFQLMNVCKKMRLFSTLGMVLVGVAGFEPATPRPERVRRLDYLMFSVKTDYVCACLFTFGLIISVGFLSGSA